MQGEKRFLTPFPSTRRFESLQRRAQQLAQGKIPTKKAVVPAKKADADIASLERELSDRLGAKVAVQHGRGGRGKLVINYHGLDALEGILEKIRGRAD